MYETINGVKDALSGLVVETDDLLGGGIGQLFQDAMKKLREKFNFGTWHYIKDVPRQYGGRTLRQLEDFSITIDMNRYLRERAHEIKIEKGRKQEMKCTPREITAGRGLMGSLKWATREGTPQGGGCFSSWCRRWLPAFCSARLTENSACIDIRRAARGTVFFHRRKWTGR